MPFDFPSSPTNGQQVTGAAGQIYQWNGTRWVGVVPPGPLPVSSGGSGSTTAAGAPWAEKATSANNVGRNLIHNPLFNIGQRGAGPFTATGYTMDRWQAVILGGDVGSFQPTTLSDADRAQIGDEAAINGFQNVFTGSAAAGAVQAVTQPTESARRLASKTVTISFWAKAAAGTPKLGINLNQNFGSGGSPSASVDALSTGASVTLSTTWTRYTTTIILPSVAGKTFGTAANDKTVLNIYYSSGANNNAVAGGIGVQSGTISIWGVQLEIGSTMTPLEKPDPADDLARCQRFFQVGTSSISMYGAPSWGYGMVQQLPVTMRATPTMAITGAPNHTNTTAAAVSGYTSGSFNPSAQIVTTGSGACVFNWTASADL